MKWQDKEALLKLAGYRISTGLQYSNGETWYWAINLAGKKPKERIICRNPSRVKVVRGAFDSVFGGKYEMAGETSNT